MRNRTILLITGIVILGLCEFVAVAQEKELSRRSNGRMFLDVTGGEKVEANLRNYNEADLSKIKDDRQKFLPGYDMAGNREIDGRNPEFRPQKLKVIAVVKHVIRGSIVFKIDSARTSTLKGYAVNASHKSVPDGSSDYWLLEKGKEALKTSKVRFTGKKSVPVVCKDFGGRTRVTAELTGIVIKRPGEKETPLGDFQLHLDIPVDTEGDKGDGLADHWERQAVGDITTLDHDTDSDKAVGGATHADSGDGLSAFDEYRGLLVNGKHYRTNMMPNDGPGGGKGGPQTKDVFILDDAGVFKKANQSLKTHGVVWHKIQKTEMDQSPLKQGRSGAVNFNGENDQVCIRIVKKNLASGFGSSTHFVNDGKSGTVVFGEPIFIDTKKIQDAVKVLKNTSKIQLRDWVIAHELGHKFGLRHPTGRRTWVAKKGATPNPTTYRVKIVAGGNFPGAYVAIDIGSNKTIGGTKLADGVAPLEQIAPKNPAGVDFNDLGAFQYTRLPPLSTKKIRLHGKLHHSRVLIARFLKVIPEAKLAAWTAKPLIVETHTGFLMDFRIDDEDHQKELSPADSKKISVDSRNY